MVDERGAVEPGAVVALAGLVLLAVGLTAWMGWYVAATVVGVVLLGTAIASAAIETRVDKG